jgi:hypothetical protein
MPVAFSMLYVYVYITFHSAQTEKVTSAMDCILSNVIPAFCVFCPVALFNVQLSQFNSHYCIEFQVYVFIVVVLSFQGFLLIFPEICYD